MCPLLFRNRIPLRISRAISSKFTLASLLPNRVLIPKVPKPRFAKSKWLVVSIVGRAMDSKEPDMGHWPYGWSPITAKRAVAQINVCNSDLGSSDFGDSKDYDQTSHE